MGNSQSELGKPPVILAGTWETKGSETNMNGLSWPCQPYKFEFHGESIVIYSESSKTGQRSEGIATRVSDREVEVRWEWITDERKRYFYKGTLRPEYVSNCMLLEGCWGSTPDCGGHVAISGYYYFELHRVSRTPQPTEAEAAILKSYNDRLRAEAAEAEARGDFDVRDRAPNPAFLGALATHALSRLGPLGLAFCLSWDLPAAVLPGLVVLCVSGILTLLAALVTLYLRRKTVNAFVDADVAHAYYLPWWETAFSQGALAVPLVAVAWAIFAGESGTAAAGGWCGARLAGGAAALVVGDVVSAWMCYYKLAFSQLKWINFGPFAYVRCPEVVVALLFGVAVLALFGSWMGLVLCFGGALVHAAAIDKFFMNTFPNYKSTSAKYLMIPYVY